MLSLGIRDLADGLALIATHFARGGCGTAFHVLDEDGYVFACGGAVDQDQGLRFYVSEGGRLGWRGLADGRLILHRSFTLPLDQRVHVVVTAEPTESRGRLESFADWLLETLQRAGIRDYEGEDTTAHLLGCFEQIRAVHDLADRLPGAEGTGEMARLCIRSLMRAVPSRLGGVYLANRGGLSDQIFLIDGTDGTGRLEVFEVPWELGRSGLIREVLEGGRVLYGPCGSLESRAGSLFERAEEDLLLVPIGFGRGQQRTTLGVIFLMDHERRSGGRRTPFGNPEAEMALSVAVLLGLAVGTRMRAAAEKELQIAQAIQQTLNPESPPAWSGLDLAGANRLANQVGGDYFDFLEGPAGELHMLVADVSGHNMASAMAMIMARSQIRLLVETMSSPAAILERLASALYGDLSRNDLFLTAFHMTMRREEGEWSVCYTNAGHNPPLVVRRSGAVEWLRGGGPVVGFMPEVTYDECAAVLRPGDLLILYTDGVTEAGNPTDGMWGEEGLLELVLARKDRTAGDLLKGILDAVERVSGPDGPTDDVTVVVIKVPEAPGTRERGAETR